MDATSAVALELKTGVPSYQVEDEERGTHLLIHLSIEEQNEHPWCHWGPDHEQARAPGISDCFIQSSREREESCDLENHSA